MTSAPSPRAVSSVAAHRKTMLEIHQQTLVTIVSITTVWEVLLLNRRKPERTQHYPHSFTEDKVACYWLTEGERARISQNRGGSPGHWLPTGLLFPLYRNGQRVRHRFL